MLSHPTPNGRERLAGIRRDYCPADVERLRKARIVRGFGSADGRCHAFRRAHVSGRPALQRDLALRGISGLGKYINLAVIAINIRATVQLSPRNTMNIPGTVSKM